jgi:uncharacterized MAPEG superfamily protein
MNSEQPRAMTALLESICVRAGISQDQARSTLEAILVFLAAKLPSPVMGRIRQALSDPENRPEH